MTKERLTPSEVELARKRRLVAMHLQEIEGNPASAEDIAMFEMFEMFEREAWTHEQRRAYILAGAARLTYLAPAGRGRREAPGEGVSPPSR